MFYYVTYYYGPEPEIIEAKDSREFHEKTKNKTKACWCAEPTREALLERKAVRYNCSCCGVSMFSTDGCYQQFQQENHMCWSCAFWTKKTVSPSALIIDGNLYSVGSEKERWKGFGGRKFHYKRWSDNIERETTNLWHGGEIPKHFRQKYPDNAEFVDGAKWHRVGDISCFG